MNRNEDKFLEKLSDNVDLNFDEINKNINYEKYRKVKKGFYFAPKFKMALTSFVLVFVIILTVILLPDNGSRRNEDKNDTTDMMESVGNTNTPSNDIATPGDSNEEPDSEFPTTMDPAGNNPGSSGPDFGDDMETDFGLTSYDGYIKQLFETNGGFGSDGDYGPMPPSPIIDSIFYIGNTEDPLYNAFDCYGKINYLYEVEYEITSPENEYIAVYLDKDLAYKIYEECHDIPDVAGASPVDRVNGSIVGWFYTYHYYDEDKVYWVKYDSNEIIKEIGNYVCVGVYKEQKRTIIKEIISNTDLNISENIYASVIFNATDSPILERVTPTLKTSYEWYGLEYEIDEDNTQYIFSGVYNNSINATIDKEANTIEIETFSVQKDELLSVDYSQALKEYHIASNQAIIQNNNEVDRLGKITYITYDYSMLVSIIYELKNK